MFKSKEEFYKLGVERGYSKEEILKKEQEYYNRGYSFANEPTLAFRPNEILNQAVKMPEMVGQQLDEPFAEIDNTNVVRQYYGAKNNIPARQIMDGSVNQAIDLNIREENNIDKNKPIPFQQVRETLKQEHSKPEDDDYFDLQGTVSQYVSLPKPQAKPNVTPPSGYVPPEFALRDVFFLSGERAFQEDALEGTLDVDYDQSGVPLKGSGGIVGSTRYGTYNVGLSQRIMENVLQGDREQVQQLIENDKIIQERVGSAYDYSDLNYFNPKRGGMMALQSAGMMAENAILGLAGSASTAFAGGVGGGLAVTSYNQQLGAGDMMKEYLYDKDVINMPDDEYRRAAEIAMTVGVPFALIEQTVNIPFVKGTGLSTAVLKPIKRKIMNKLMKQPELVKRIAAGGVDAVYRIIGETIEEGGQFAAQEIGGQGMKSLDPETPYLKEIQNIVTNADYKKVGVGAVDTMVQALPAVVVMGGASATVEATFSKKYLDDFAEDIKKAQDSNDPESETFKVYRKAAVTKLTTMGLTEDLAEDLVDQAVYAETTEEVQDVISKTQSALFEFNQSFNNVGLRVLTNADWNSFGKFMSEEQQREFVQMFPEIQDDFVAGVNGDTDAQNRYNAFVKNNQDAQYLDFLVKQNVQEKSKDQPRGLSEKTKNEILNTNIHDEKVEEFRKEGESLDDTKLRLVYDLENRGDPFIRERIANIRKSLLRLMPNLQIIVAENDEQYLKLTGLEKASAGVYNNGRIILNGKRVNKTTIAHEAFHALLDNYLGVDTFDTAINTILDNALKVASPELVARIEAHRDLYSDYSEIGQREEMIAELAGILSATHTELPSTRKGIKNYKDRLLGLVGLKTKSMPDKEVIDMFNSVVQGFSTGQTLAETQVETVFGTVNTENAKRQLEQRNPLSEEFKEAIKTHATSKERKLGQFYAKRGNYNPVTDYELLKEAIRISELKKVDPQQYKSPADLIDKFAGEVKAKPINPNNIPELGKKTELDQGFEMFEVNDDLEMQPIVRNFVDTHWGEETNPWCITQVGDEYDDDRQFADQTYRADNANLNEIEKELKEINKVYLGATTEIKKTERLVDAISRFEQLDRDFTDRIFSIFAIADRLEPNVNVAHSIKYVADTDHYPSSIVYNSIDPNDSNMLRANTFKNEGLDNIITGLLGTVLSVRNYLDKNVSKELASILGDALLTNNKSDLKDYISKLGLGERELTEDSKEYWTRYPNKQIVFKNGKLHSFGSEGVFYDRVDEVIASPFPELLVEFYGTIDVDDNTSIYLNIEDGKLFAYEVTRDIANKVITPSKGLAGVELDSKDLNENEGKEITEDELKELAEKYNSDVYEEYLRELDEAKMDQYERGAELYEDNPKLRNSALHKTLYVGEYFSKFGGKEQRSFSDDELNDFLNSVQGGSTSSSLYLDTTIDNYADLASGLDLNVLIPSDRISFQDQMAEAVKFYGLDADGNFDQVLFIEEITNIYVLKGMEKGRVTFNSTQQAGFVLAVSLLDQSVRSMQSQLNDLKINGQLEASQRLEDKIIFQKSKIEQFAQILVESRSETARVLGSHRNTIRDDYTEENVLRKALEASPEGLSSLDEQYLRTRARKLSELNERIDNTETAVNQEDDEYYDGQVDDYFKYTRENVPKESFLAKARKAVKDISNRAGKFFGKFGGKEQRIPDARARGGILETDNYKDRPEILCARLAELFISDDVKDGKPLDKDSIINRIKRVLEQDGQEFSVRDIKKAIAENTLKQYDLRKQYVSFLSLLKISATLDEDLSKAASKIFDTEKIVRNNSANVKAVKEILDKMIANLDALANTVNTVYDDKLVQALREKIENIRKLANDVTHPKLMGKRKSEVVTEAQRELADLKKQSSVRKQIEELNKIIENKEFDVQLKKKEKALGVQSKELKKLLRERARLRTEINKRIAEIERRRRGFLRNLGLDLATVSRASLSMLDNSAVMNQGVFYWSLNPPAAMRDTMKNFLGFFVAGVATDIDNANKYNAQKYDLYNLGINLSEIDGGLLKGEEDFATRLFDTPLFKAIGVKFVKDASERAYVNFLNSMRIQLAVDFLNKHGQTTSEERIKEYFEFINSVSGRPTMPRSFENAAEALSYAFFSPRLTYSRLTLPVTSAYKLLQIRKDKSGRLIQRKIFRAWFGFFAFYATIITLCKLGGADVGDDPEDADYGKIVVGKRRFDISGGFKNTFRLFALAIKYPQLSKEDRKNIDLGEQIGRMFKWKLHPMFGATYEAFHGRDWVTKEDKEIKDIAFDSFAPIFLQNVKEAIDEDVDLEDLPLDLTLSFFGVGTQVYDKKDRKKKSKTQGTVIDLLD
jgi:hypothetical protein